MLVSSYFKYFCINMTVLYNFKNTYTAVVKAAKSAFTLVSAKPPSMNLFHVTVSFSAMADSKPSSHRQAGDYFVNKVK